MATTYDTSSTFPFEGPPEPESAELEAIGPYRLIAPLGEGGMGEVFLAEQTEPVARRVALKLLRVGRSDRRMLARFEAERQAMALMDHPSIATIFDAGISFCGRPWFAMEYIQGVPITDYCDRHRLDVEARLDLFMRVCEGVQHAHQKAVIHRDLKPSNVMVTIHEGRAHPKIIDFGVAKTLERPRSEHPFETEVGQIIGTPEYMSPEQAENTGLAIDTRTDIYALGVMLYELLSGTLPFDPKTLRGPDLGRTIRDRAPAKPSSRVDTHVDAARYRSCDVPALRRRLRGDLDWIVLRALEKDRTRRYGSAAELIADIERHLRHEPVEAGPPTASYRVRKFVRRHRLPVAFAVTVSTAVIAGLGATAWLWAVAERHRADASETAADLEVAVAEKTRTLEAERDQRYLADLRTTQMGIQGGDVGMIPMAQWPAEERGLEAEILVGRCSGGEPLIDARDIVEEFVVIGDRVTTAGGARCATYSLTLRDTISSNSVNAPSARRVHAVSPDARWVVLELLDREEIRLWDRTTGNEGPLLLTRDDRFAPIDVTFSRCGLVAINPVQPNNHAELDGVRVFDTDGRAVFEGPFATAIAFGPNRQLATASDDIRIIDIDSGDVVFEAQASRNDPVTAMTFDDTGTRLAVVTRNSARIIPLDGGRPVALPNTSGSVAAFDPSGQHLAVADGAGLRVVRADTGQQVWHVLGHALDVTSLVFSDSRTLFSGSLDHTVRRWEIVPRPLLASMDMLLSAAVHPEGELAVVVGKRGDDCVGELIDVPSGEVITQLERVGEAWIDYSPSVAYAPNGEMFATAHTDGIRLWNGLDGTRFDLIKNDDVPDFYIALRLVFGADGKTIYTAETDMKNMNRLRRLDLRTRVWEDVMLLPDDATELRVDGATGAVAVVSKSRVFVTHPDRATLEVESITLDTPGGLAFSPDGARLLITGRRPSMPGAHPIAVIVDAFTGEPVDTLPLTHDNALCALWPSMPGSPRPRLLVGVTESRRYGVQIRDLGETRRYESLITLPTPRPPVAILSDADTSRVFAVTGRELLVWEATNHDDSDAVRIGYTRNRTMERIE